MMQYHNDRGEKKDEQAGFKMSVFCSDRLFPLQSENRKVFGQILLTVTPPEDDQNV